VRASRVSVVSGFVRACRPRQWVKNLLVLLAPAGAGLLLRGAVPLPALAALFVAFCLVSSGTYLDNDVLDAPVDRFDPRKASRPVASGALPVRAARVGSVALVLVGTLLALRVSPAAAALVALYAGNTLLYSRRVKHVPFVEVAALAAGFVLRAAAGAMVTSAPLAGWFLPLVASVAVFVVLVKRSSEIVEGVSRRRVLAVYDPVLLARLRRFVLASALCLYSGWALSRPDVVAALASVPPLVVTLGRVEVAARSGRGSEPERLVFSDRVVLVASLAWFALFLLASS